MTPWILFIFALLWVLIELIGWVLRGGGSEEYPYDDEM